MKIFTDWSRKVNDGQGWSRMVNEQFKKQKRNCLVLVDNAVPHTIADMVVTKVGSFEYFKMSNL